MSCAGLKFNSRKYFVQDLYLTDMRAFFISVGLFLLTSSAIAQQTLPTNNLLPGYQEFPTIITGHSADGSGSQYYTGISRGQLKMNNQVLATGNGLLK